MACTLASRGASASGLNLLVMPQTVIEKFVELVCLVVNGKRAESDASVSVLLRGGVGQHNDFCCGSLRLQLSQHAEARASLQEQVKHSQAPRPVMGVEPLNGLHFSLSSPDDLCITNVVDCITMNRPGFLRHF